MVDTVLALCFFAVLALGMSWVWSHDPRWGGRWLGVASRHWLLLRKALVSFSAGIVFAAICTTLLGVVLYIAVEGLRGDVVAASRWLMVMVIAYGGAHCAEIALAEGRANNLPVCLLTPSRPACQRVQPPGRPAVPSYRDPRRVSPLARAILLAALGILGSISLHVIGWASANSAAWLCAILLLAAFSVLQSAVAHAEICDQTLRGNTVFGLRRFQHDLRELRISYLYYRRGASMEETLVATRLGGWPLLFLSRGQGYIELSQRILAEVIKVSQCVESQRRRDTEPAQSAHHHGLR